MRRPSPWNSQRHSSELQLTPLIDVIFLLLVFFVWNVNLQPPEMELRSEVTPNQASPQPAPGGAVVSAAADYEPIVVHIGWREGRPWWAFGKQELPDRQTLAARLTEVAAINSAAPLVVHPAPEVPLGSVVDVYDLARQTGFQQIQFTANLGVRP